jgi:hypothetical protein
MANTPIRDAKRAATRAKIEAAAKAVFDAKGWEGSTIRLIAKTAGVSTGAIFSIWPDGKRSLWREIIKTEPPVDGALWRSAPGMLSVLQALQSADDADKAQGSPSMAGPRRSAIDAIVASATTPLPFEVR